MAQIHICGNSLAFNAITQLEKISEKKIAFKVEAVRGAKVLTGPTNRVNSIRSQLRRSNQHSISLLIEPISIELKDQEFKDGGEKFKELEAKIMREMRAIDKELCDDGKMTIIIRAELGGRNGADKNIKLDNIYNAVAGLQSFIVSPEVVAKMHVKYRDGIHHTVTGEIDLATKMYEWLGIIKQMERKGMMHRTEMHEHPRNKY